MYFEILNLFCFRDVPSAGLYMITYEHSCCILKKLLHSDKKTESMPMYICAISGGFAGNIINEKKIICVTVLD